MRLEKYRLTRQDLLELVPMGEGDTCYGWFRREHLERIDEFGDIFFTRHYD